MKAPYFASAALDFEGSWGKRSASRALVVIAWRSRVSVEKPCLVREHDCLDAVTEVELLENVRDVCLDGRIADVELSADLGVREAAGDQAAARSSGRGAPRRPRRPGTRRRRGNVDTDAPYPSVASLRTLLPPYARPELQSSRFAQMSTAPPRCSLSRSSRWTGDGPKRSGTRSKRSIPTARDPIPLRRL
jgi:hypothetical protein